MTVLGSFGQLNYSVESPFSNSNLAKVGMLGINAGSSHTATLDLAPDILEACIDKMNYSSCPPVTLDQLEVASPVWGCALAQGTTAIIVVSRQPNIISRDCGTVNEYPRLEIRITHLEGLSIGSGFTVVQPGTQLGYMCRSVDANCPTGLPHIAFKFVINQSAEAGRDDEVGATESEILPILLSPCLSDLYTNDTTTTPEQDRENFRSAFHTCPR